MERAHSGDPEEGASWDRRDSLFFTAAALTFVLTRVAWVVWNPDAASYWEESYRWYAAHELLGESRLPLLDYQADHYQGGSLLMALLAIPFFAAAGESLLSFKLSAIVVSTATLAMLFALNRRFFGHIAARVAALAYLSGPPLVAFWGVVPMGFHADSSLISLLQIYAYLGLVSGAWRTDRGWLAFGLACGAGLSFTYITALSAIACMIAWLVVERAPRVREVAWAALGALLGLLPWLAYNLGHGFAGIGRLREVFGTGEAVVDTWHAQSLGERILDLLTRMPTEGLLDPANTAPLAGLQPIVALGLLLPAGIALLGGLGRMRRVTRDGSLPRSNEREQARRELVFFVYLGIFVLAYLASPFTLEGDAHMIVYRLFPPLIVVLITPIALSAQAWMRSSGTAGSLAALATAVGLVSSGAASLAFAARPAAPEGISLEHGYRIAGRLLHRKYASLPRVLAHVRYDDARLEALVLWGVGWEIQHRFEVGGSLEDVVALVRSIPPRERVLILEGMRWTAEERAKTLSSPQAGREVDTAQLDRIVSLWHFVRGELDALRTGAPG